MEAAAPGAQPGGSPEGEAGAGGRPRGPGRCRAVRFRMPPTAISVPSVREEEPLFYRRLEELVAPGPGGFGPLFAADGWSDLTGECPRRAPAAAALTARVSPAGDRLLRKRVVWDGRGGPRPRPGQEVSVKALGALEDGGLVERDPRLTFVPGHGDVVQALELGVPTMEPGEVCFLLAASPYGYGRPGREPDVPPEAPLLFEVTLMEVRDGPDPRRPPPAARLRLGAQKRERGNFHFARGDFAAALRSYRLALRALDGSGAAPPGPQEEEELREQRVKCLNNCAAAELKLRRPGEALACCEAALCISPDNGKALFRQGKLLAEQGRDEEAALVLKRALRLEPASKAVHAELSRLVKRRAGRQPPPAPEEPRDDPPRPRSPGPSAVPAAGGLA
ncbi:peptidyl-prolyl cis-trans isomerase FKBP8-like [Apteryx mantelli]|uniref:peptidylprolyl isomerase n=1 Tax=Apteryx mantelli TaxID=2696672 RepID=A0ABM4FAA5_9AVES